MTAGNIEIKLNSGIKASLEGVISRGIKACRINDDGHLIFTLTDDTELDIGKVTGEDGVSITGISTQASSVSGGDNVVTITLSDGSITTFNVKNGIKGDPGKDGHSPIKGIDYYTPSEIEEIKTAVTPVKGRDYFDGTKGDPGYTPVKGVDYFDGEDGYTPIKGKDYFDGNDGYTPVKGKDYFDGEPGHSPVITASKSGRATTIYADGIAIAIVLDGEPGSGSGDMSASVYDTHGKRVDIFDYVDNAVSSVPKSWNDITDKPSTFPPSTHTHSQYLTEEEDPTVPSWAKEPSKPTYTPEEVGALPEDKVFWAIYGQTTYAEITQAVADGKIILLWYSNRLYKYGGLSTYHYFVCDLTATASYYVRVSTSNAWSNSSSTALTNSIFVKSTQTTAESDSNVYTALRTKNELATVEGKIPTAVSQLTNDSGYITEYTETDPTVPAWAKSSDYKDKIDSLWEDYQLALGVI